VTLSVTRVAIAGKFFLDLWKSWRKNHVSGEVENVGCCRLGEKVSYNIVSSKLPLASPRFTAVVKSSQHSYSH
jgi:hypothetical protein